MATAGTPVSPGDGKRFRHLLRVLRPLAWWVLLVLVLYAYRTHQRLAAQTHLDFSVSLEGQPLQFDVSATVDGQPVASGERVPLGHHRFTVSHPKADSYSTNLFIWYGAHNLGRINLKRSRGTLTVTANPPAGLITIMGPEFSLRLTNSTGLTTNIPTDRYTVEAHYAHWQQVQEAPVLSMGATGCVFAPRLGTAQLTCNQSGASFQILDSAGQLLEAGNLPATVSEVPRGNYTLVAWHHGHKIEQTLAVAGDGRNQTEIQFLYGAVRLESDPPGATVITGEGQNLGVTPRLLSELTAGRLRIEMRLAGYSPATVDVEITALTTNTFHTDLVSLDYSRAIAAARQYISQGDYDRAFGAAADALQAKANDIDATALQEEAARKGQEALGKRHVRQAEALGKNSDYIAAARELEAALQLLPDTEEAKQLLADFKKRVPEQLERLRAERAERGKKMFDIAVASVGAAELFDTHELKTGKHLEEVKAAILEALKIPTEFRVTLSASRMPETFEIDAEQEFTTALGTSAGRRQCVIVGAQTRDDETQILFKVLEFKAVAVNKFSIGAWIGAPGEVNYVPIHPSRISQMTDKMRAQVEEGQKMVMERIQQAIGGGKDKK